MTPVIAILGATVGMMGDIWYEDSSDRIQIIFCYFWLLAALLN